MPTKAQNGVLLVRHSITLLRHHKRLFVFPFLGYVCKYAIFLLIVKPFIHTKELEALHNQLPHKYILPIILGFMVVLFFINLILFFFNSAIIENILAFIRSKKEASVFYGFKCAFKNSLRVYLWALYAGTFGAMVNLLPKSSTLLKRIQTNTLKNNHWNVAAFFAFMQVIDKQYGPVKTLKISASCVQRTWGENLRPRFVFTLYTLLIKLAALIPLLIGTIDGAHNMIILGACISVFFLLLISTTLQLIHTTWRVVCYCYVTDGLLAAPFEKDLFDDLFR